MRSKGGGLSATAELLFLCCAFGHSPLEQRPLVVTVLPRGGEQANQHPERCPARNDGEFIDGESATFCRDTADDNRKRRTDHHRVDRRSMCVTSLRQRPARQPNQTACRPMKYFVIGRQRWRRQRRVGSLWRPRLSVGLQPARTGRAAVKSLSRLRLVQRPAKFTLCRRAELSTVTVLRDVLGGDKRCRKKNCRPIDYNKQFCRYRRDFETSGAMA